MSSTTGDVLLALGELRSQYGRVAYYALDWKRSDYPGLHDLCAPCHTRISKDRKSESVDLYRAQKTTTMLQVNMIHEENLPQDLARYGAFTRQGFYDVDAQRGFRCRYRRMNVLVVSVCCYWAFQHQKYSESGLSRSRRSKIGVWTSPMATTISPTFILQLLRGRAEDHTRRRGNKAEAIRYFANNLGTKV